MVFPKVGWVVGSISEISVLCRITMATMPMMAQTVTMIKTAAAVLDMRDFLGMVAAFSSQP